MYVVANHVVNEDTIESSEEYEQLDLFTDYQKEEQKHEEEKEEFAKEHKRQKAILQLQKKYGKNAVLKGMNLEEGATTVDRNKQIGGHKA